MRSLIPGSPFPVNEPGIFTQEQLAWINAHRVPGIAARLITPQYRSGFLTPNGTFVRSPETICIDWPYMKPARDYSSPELIVLAQLDRGAVIVLDVDGRRIDHIETIPTRSGVAALLAAHKIDRSIADHWVQHAPIELPPLDPGSTDINEYSADVPDLVDVDRIERDGFGSAPVLPPKHGTTWQNEIARLENLIRARTTIMTFTEDQSLEEAITENRQRIADLERRDDAKAYTPPKSLRAIAQWLGKQSVLEVAAVVLLWILVIRSFR